MKYWMLIFTFISVQAFAAEQMSYDCRKWKNNPEPEDKSQYFVKDDDSVGFFNESEHFFISEANKAPILFMKDKDVFISVNGQDGFSFAAVSNTDLKKAIWKFFDKCVHLQRADKIRA